MIRRAMFLVYHTMAVLLGGMMFPQVAGAAGALDPIALLSEYIEVDTVNPPGNEANAVAFYARYLKAAGIDYVSGSRPLADPISGRALKAAIRRGLCFCSTPMLCRRMSDIGQHHHLRRGLKQAIYSVVVRLI